MMLPTPSNTTTEKIRLPEFIAGWEGFLTFCFNH
jgi:hypothetical protein